MESTIYEVTQEHYEKRVLSVTLSFLGIKTLRLMNT